MEIEVLLPVNNKISGKEYVQAQKNLIERISFASSTFTMFTLVNDVIDINKRKVVTKSSLLSKVYKSPDEKPFTFVICRN